MSISYVTIGINDLERSRPYYDAIMSHLGGTIETEIPEQAICYSLPYGQRVWITQPQNGEPASQGNGTMVGFLCADEAEVRATHATALANGGTNEGDPGPRPIYGPHFYGGYARDPEGNKMSFVFFRDV